MQLKLFWDRFEVLQPGHTVFQLARDGRLRLDMTTPLMIHGDEGRGRKKTAVMIINVQSCLGFGVATAKRKHGAEQRGPRMDQEMNYVGHTYTTRFMLSCLPKATYSDSKVFYDMLEALSEDLSLLATDGLVGLDGKTRWFAPVACKGDMPFLVKAGRLERSFYNQPKHGDAKNRKQPVGICHLCQAGQVDTPFEDLSLTADWIYTQGFQCPWKSLPEMLQNCCHNTDAPETFFHYDPWHCWHLGEGRGLACNAVALILDVTPGANLGDKIDALFADYKHYCKLRSLQVFVSRFTKDMFGLTGSDYPAGSWVKGNFTTSILKWICDYLTSRKNSFQEGSLLAKVDPWCDAFFFPVPDSYRNIANRNSSGGGHKNNELCVAAVIPGDAVDPKGSGPQHCRRCFLVHGHLYGSCRAGCSRAEIAASYEQ